MRRSADPEAGAVAGGGTHDVGTGTTTTTTTTTTQSPQSPQAPLPPPPPPPPTKLQSIASSFQGPINWYYVFTIVVIGCGSIPKGYDEGGFSAATSLASFKNDFDLNSNSTQWVDNASGLASRKANITSFGVLGAAFGSLIALAMTDRVGRLRCWQALVLIYMSGYLMQVFSSGIYGFLLFARIWGGLGAGGLTVVGPLYLSEIAPAKSRGMIVSISMVFLLSFLSLGKFVPIKLDQEKTKNKTLFPTHKNTHVFVRYQQPTRLLHQLRRKRNHETNSGTIPPRHRHPLDPRRLSPPRLHLHLRHTPMARLQGPR